MPGSSLRRGKTVTPGQKVYIVACTRRRFTPAPPISPKRWHAAACARLQTIGQCPPTDSGAAGSRLRWCVADEEPLVRKVWRVTRSRGGAWPERSRRRHVLFKICSTFDSTDAANIGPVYGCVARRWGDPIVLCDNRIRRPAHRLYGAICLRLGAVNESHQRITRPNR